jgi:hypothetical protein
MPLHAKPPICHPCQPPSSHFAYSRTPSPFSPPLTQTSHFLPHSPSVQSCRAPYRHSSCPCGFPALWSITLTPHPLSVPFVWPRVSEPAGPVELLQNTAATLRPSPSNSAAPHVLLLSRVLHVLVAAVVNHLMSLATEKRRRPDMIPPPYRRRPLLARHTPIRPLMLEPLPLLHCITWLTTDNHAIVCPVHGDLAGARRAVPSAVGQPRPSGSWPRSSEVGHWSMSAAASGRSWPFTVHHFSFFPKSVFI